MACAPFSKLTLWPHELEALSRSAKSKSFPVVDGQAEPDKVGAALDQAATYILLIKQLAANLDHAPDLISTEALLITPHNVGLRPVLSSKDVANRVDRIQRLLARVPTAADVTALVPAGASFGVVADQRPASERRANARDPEAGHRIDRLHTLADDVGTTFGSGCESCGAYRFCRSRAIAVGSPQIAGPLVARVLPGVHSRGRAADLAAGAPPGPVEAPAAIQLARAARLYDRHAPALPAAAGGLP